MAERGSDWDRQDYQDYLQMLDALRKSGTVLSVQREFVAHSYSQPWRGSNVTRAESMKSHHHGITSIIRHGTGQMNTCTARQVSWGNMAAFQENGHEGILHTHWPSNIP